jgi:hypothetical protein
VHASGDVGVMALAVGNATNAALAADGDYIPLTTDTTGAQRVIQEPRAITVLASAARTTTQTQADQTNLSGKGITIVVDVTTAGTGSITMTINVKDSVSGKYITLLSGAAITTNSTTRYRVYPGLTAAANSVASDVLGRTWRIVITHNNANTITYSVGAEVIP